ncbi:hypothetical protein ABMA27_004052 [Loxostege sticticalis]|uniref:Ninjurin n=1 Tax=Loxostege sticticalis TaxID=481309 RepID=A0ABR3HRC5_LOXSC
MSNTTSPRAKSPRLDLNDVEMIFGTPNSPKPARPDVHTVTNEKPGKESSPTNNNRAVNKDSGPPPTLPLLEPDKGKQQPPLAGPEIDDLDEKPEETTPFHGIDDGLLEPIDKTPEIFSNGDVDREHKDPDGPNTTHDDGVGTEDGKWLWPNDETDYPYDLGTRFGADDRPVSPMPGSIPDVNTYQQKKNLAQGMMDLALLSANANQLRYVIESSSGGHPYYYSSIVFISLSIILQIAVGVGLIMNSRYNVKDEKDICKADKINNMTVLGIFLITIVNVFISSFSVAPTSTGIAPGNTAIIQQAGV